MLEELVKNWYKARTKIFEHEFEYDKKGITDNNAKTSSDLWVELSKAEWKLHNAASEMC